MLERPFNERDPAMFTYFEGYHPRVWSGLVKRGLVRKMTGLRFCQNIMLPDALKFNALAAPGGEFHRLFEELGAPMYIDRLQGGVYIDNYPYDPKLLNLYRDSGRFWGFQMHEWMSNYTSDIHKLTSNGCPSWSAEDIESTLRRAYPGKCLFLEAMRPHEMAALGFPETVEQFCAHAAWLFERRLEEVGELIPCDSAYLAFKYELEAMGLGKTHRFMPEVGAQSVDSKLQIVYARSMARAYGAEFGVYYEPWGGDPFSACCYNRVSADNEWGIGASDDFPFQTMGENGGSSRSLQRRIHLYSYFSGADFMSEEWGMCNTFYDWNDHELTPYGKIKYDFLDLVEKYPDQGKKLTPVAVVLPRNLSVLETIRAQGKAFGYPQTGHAADALETMRAGLRALFSDRVPMVGTETENFLNTEIPDALDLIHSDAPTLADYDYLVDLSGGEIPTSLAHKVISVAEAPDVARRALPCNVTGGAHWMVNETADGGHYLILFNHSGIVRSVSAGELTIPEAALTATVTLKGDRHLERLEGSTAVTKTPDGYKITIAPGDWFLGKF